ncbi:MAG: hydantoinase/oxoprolinase family protein, partial [Propionibacteriaceae bacterium]|nr:hydantoinase/oxoprolinase family protein [Propionibacteriaceae bacterium]
MTLRVGIDVGGTTTDAVVVDEADRLVAAAKAATTPQPFDGIRRALAEVTAGVDPADVTHAMLGTTHLINALIERKGLARVGVLRLSGPASTGLRPGVAWPTELAASIIGPTAIVGGGFEYDGSEIAPLDEPAIRRFAEQAAGRVQAVAVTGAFSMANPGHEERALSILAAELGDDVPVSLSHMVGTLGLAARENATILNASVVALARRVIDGFHDALAARGLEVESFLTRNDGTLMTAETAVRFPLLTVNASVANSMRGASRLADVRDALVLDVGGTTADLGTLVAGFPKQSTAVSQVSGVTTNFPLPEVSSIALGGGTVVSQTGDAVTIGPGSVGYRVATESLIAGGAHITLSDVSVRSGRRLGFGDPALADQIPDHLASEAMRWVEDQIAGMVARAKVPREGLPLVAVGGGAHLVPDRVPGVDQVVRPDHHAVANAYGAAIAEVSGAIDRVFHYGREGREQCLERARDLAVDAAARAGARRSQVRVTFVREVPLAYVTGQMCRV